MYFFSTESLANELQEFISMKCIDAALQPIMLWLKQKFIQICEIWTTMTEAAKFKNRNSFMM